jgi:multidrug efflux system outer membrane protein
VAAKASLSAPPSIPLTLPSQLLEHRPDLAAAERRLASASEQIGAATAGYFPAVRLAASGGFDAADTGNLFKWGSRFLEAGPGVTLPLFTGGRTQSQVDASRARLEEARAAWEQQVLVAFKEVEDALRDQQLLDELHQRDAETLAAAHDVAGLSDARYRGGLVSYLDVVDAQRTELEAERALAQSAGQRLIASVELVKALGGGWQAGVNSSSGAKMTGPAAAGAGQSAALKRGNSS